MTILENSVFANNLEMTLTGSMTASIFDDVLPLSAPDKVTLDALVPVGKTMTGTLSGTSGIEIVQLFNTGVEVAATRAQESTSAVTWIAGDKLSVRNTAGTMDDIVTVVETLEDTNDSQQTQIDMLVDSILVDQNGDVLSNQNGNVITL